MKYLDTNDELNYLNAGYFYNILKSLMEKKYFTMIIYFYSVYKNIKTFINHIYNYNILDFLKEILILSNDN